MPMWRWIRHSGSTISCAAKRPVPGQRVVIVRVDEGAVDVEQRCGRRHEWACTAAPARSNGRPGFSPGLAGTGCTCRPRCARCTSAARAGTTATGASACIRRAAGAAVAPALRRRCSTRSRSTRPSTGCRRAMRWRTGPRETPPDFVFAVKASRYLTHIKRLTELGQGVERFYERIEPLIEAGKLGPGAVAAAGELQVRSRAPRCRPGAASAPAATASSSATRAGSTTTSTGCCAPRRRAGDRSDTPASVPDPRDDGRLDLPALPLRGAAGGQGTTRPRSSRSGGGGSRAGAHASRCSPTSTTTGARSQ